MGTKGTESGQDQQHETGAEERSEEVAEQEADEALMDEEREPLVSAKDLPAPATILAIPPKEEIDKLTISLSGDLTEAPSIEEVRQINEDLSSESRTPLMAVIESVLAENGGTLPLSDLSSLVGQYWNRQFPSSPYSQEEFIYILALNSDKLRVRGPGEG
ncbi:MAG: hypothetical protein P8182_16905 [Deltaproteobacteria bacterium]